MKNIDTLLSEEVVRNLGIIKGLDPESEEYRNRTDWALKLIDRGIKIEELDFEHDEMLRKRKFEEQTKRDELKEDKKRFQIKFWEGVGVFVITLGFNYLCLRGAFKFEETGSFTSKSSLKCFNNAFTNK